MRGILREKLSSMFTAMFRWTADARYIHTHNGVVSNHKRVRDYKHLGNHCGALVNTCV
jgi:hypothetical protein